jgi:hypothetical protein
MHIQMKIINLLFVFTVLLFAACSKNNGDAPNPRTCNAAGDGVLSATINSQPWAGCEFKAVYYTKDKILCINAIDQFSKFELRFFITLDTVSQLKTYAINANEKSGIEIIEGLSDGNNFGSDIYFCDLISPATGGSVTITKLDTLTGKITASFNVTGYSQSQHKTITVTNGLLNDVKLTKSALAYSNPSFISVTINGVNWYNKAVYARVNEYIASPVYSFLEVRAMGYPADLGECPQYNSSFSRDVFWANGRNLVFNIPLSQGVGTYPLQPSNLYHQTILSQHYLFSYNHHDMDNSFYPISGSNITITSIDTANRNLDALFNTQVKDSTGTSINFVSGRIHIKNWYPF